MALQDWTKGEKVKIITKRDVYSGFEGEIKDVLVEEKTGKVKILVYNDNIKDTNCAFVQLKECPKCGYSAPDVKILKLMKKHRWYYEEMLEKVKE